jgi:hypothetical protein
MPKAAGSGLAELGDVIGGVSPGQPRDALVQLREVIFYRRERSRGLWVEDALHASCFVQRGSSKFSRTKWRPGLYAEPCQGQIRASVKVNDLGN